MPRTATTRVPHLRFTTARLAAMAGLAVSSLALATPRTWTNAAGGSAATSTNWSPAAVPGAADALSFGLAGTYAVTYNATVPTDATLDFNAGTVSISSTSPHTTTTQLVVGHTGTSTVNLTSGQFSVGGPIAMGSVGSSGTLTVTGPASSLLQTAIGASLRVGNGSSPSTGTLNILNGGLVQTAGNVLVASFGAAQGTLHVSGVNGVTHSRLITTDASAGDITLGSAGNATMTVDAGGQVTSADQLIIAPVSGFTGSLSVGTAGNGTVTVAHDLLLGSNSTAAASGTGTLTIGTAGLVDVNGVTRVGDADGGTGTLDLSSGGQLFTTGLVVDSVNGNLIHTDGLILNGGGAFVPGGMHYVLDGVGNPVLTLTTNGTLASAGAVTIGGAHSGTLNVLSAGSMISSGSGFEMTLGLGTGSNGAMTVNNGGIAALGFNGVLVVGSHGTGTCSVGTHGAVQGTSCLIAESAGSVGACSVDGAAALLDMQLTVAVGGSGSGPGGSGSLVIANGGRVDTASLTVWTPGSLSMDGGVGAGATLNVSGIATFNQAAMTMTNGTINAGQLVVNNTDISASGVINARVSVNASASTITATGPLTMGNALFTDGFVNLGTLDVGAQSVTLLDSQFAGGGNILINGGTLTGPGGLGTFPNKSLSGTGTINGAYSNSGSITATGASGLTFNGVISGVGQGISGTKITLGGGFTGSGTINTQVVSLPGSTITATGTLSMGDSLGPTDLCTIGGTVLCGANFVQLVDQVRPTVTGTVEVQGGSLAAVPNAAGILLLRTGAEPALLRGNGSVSHVLHNNGRVNPGLPTGDLTQTLNMFGGYDQRGVSANVAGTLEVDLEGPLASQKDLIQVTGTAFLDGTLLVNRRNGFLPTIGEQFTILTATSVSGTFTNVTGRGFVAVYSPTDVKVVFVGYCDSADFNCDEDIGTDADIEAFFRCLAGNCPPNCGNDADFNNDGDIGTDADIEAFFRVLAGGPCF